MKIKDIIFNIILLSALSECLQAQSERNRFKAGVAVGAAFSQMDGDLQQGYHRLGYVLGINGSYFLKSHIDISTELSLNSRGARPNPRTEKFGKDELQTTLNLHYAEARLVANWHFAGSSDMRYFRQSIHAGLLYGRLLSSKLEVIRGDKTDDVTAEAIKSVLKNSDLGVTVGWSWHFSPRISVMVQHAVSLVPIYRNSKVATDKQDFERFIPYHFSLQVRYDFISPKWHIYNKKKTTKLKAKDNPLEQIE